MQINSVKQKDNGFLVNGSFIVPNDPKNSDYQEIQKWIASGGSIVPEFTKEEEKKNLRKKLILSRMKYLSSTDFRVLRFVDEATPYPNEIKTKRILARQEINQIEACTTIEQLKQFSEDFNG